MREGVQNIVVEKKLEPYLDDSLLIDGRLLPYLMTVSYTHLDVYKRQELDL